MPDKDQNAIAIVNQMKKDRKWVEPYWSDVNLLVSSYLREITSVSGHAFDKFDELYAGEGMANMEVFTRGIYTQMLGGDADWFEAGIFGDKRISRDRTAMDFFEEIRLILLDELDRSQFFNRSPASINIAGSIGTHFASINGDYWNDTISYVPSHPGDVFLDVDSAGNGRYFAIRAKVSLNDLIEQNAALSDQEKKDIAMARRPPGRPEALTKREKVVWQFYRRLGPDDEKINPLSKWKFQLLSADGHVYLSSEFQNVPGAMWFMEYWPGANYGLSPCLKALRQLLQMNKTQKLLMKEANYRGNPPLWVPHTSPVDFIDPGSVIQSDKHLTGEYPRRVMEPADIQPLFELKAEMNQLLRVHLLTDFMLALEGFGRRTEVEVQAKIMQGNTQIAPVVQSVETFLMRVIRRYMEVMIDQDRMPDPPRVVKSAARKGKTLGIRFIGPLSKMRRMGATIRQDMEALTGYILPLAQMGPQAAEEVLDRFDAGAAVSRVQEFMGGGKSIIRTKEEADALKLQRMLMQLQQQKAETNREAMKQTQEAETGSPAAAAMGAQ